MSYIRDRKEELTGFQEEKPWNANIDIQCDFVMVYGISSTMPERVRRFREKGYVVHLMTGVSWGQYKDYLYGKFDGRNHWDESQMDRKGDYIQHGIDVPYMSPTIAFTNYLIENLKVAVDAGVEAIHMEEPEFWDYGGYSKAFQREYLLYYREPWQPPDSSLDVRYKASKLKAHLYARTLERIGSALKEYALVHYDRVLHFYVPTHSLVNYTQWKIMSPEGALIDLPSIDGYIAQVWTGTSRSENVYEGVVKERTFETAFLEYGIMQELVKGTNRRMWFLHDPIEDNPGKTWEDYQYNYLKTAVASLLHPAVFHYEICPWPDRVFNGIYPKAAGLAGGTIAATELEGAKPIPPAYATLINSMVQLFGDMEQKDYIFDGINGGVGVLMSDSGLFQRSYPDGVVDPGILTNVETQLKEYAAFTDGKEDFSEVSRRFMKAVYEDSQAVSAFIQSGTFPNFYGMVLPLLKYGLPVRPVQLDNVRRFSGYLADYSLLVLSYEYIKPEAPDVNNALAAWVKGGGTLLYIGDGSDPYHQIDGWWNRTQMKYANPAMHLFEMLGLPGEPVEGIQKVDKGHVMIWNMLPAKICMLSELADDYRGRIKELLAINDSKWEFTNQLTLRRGPYIVSAVMDEGPDESVHTFQGLFADMLAIDYTILTEKTIKPDENTVLFDFSRIEDEECRMIGCSARVFSLDITKEKSVFHMEVKAAGNIKAFLRIRFPGEVISIIAKDKEGKRTDVAFEWDFMTRTALLSYESNNQYLFIEGEFKKN